MMFELVIILAPLRIVHTNPLTAMSAYEGETIELQCYFEGQPKPKISWTNINGKWI